MDAPRLLLHGLFIFVGVATTMLGPLLPSLMRRWSLSDSQAGALFTAQFLMAVVGSLLVVWLMRHFRAWHLLLVGYCLCGTGVLGLAAPSWHWGFAGACLSGFGLGLINPTANLSSASLMPGEPAKAINLLNFFFSIGATLAPPVIAGFVDRDLSAWFPLALSISMLGGTAIASRYFVADFEGSGGSKDAAAQRPHRFRFAALSMTMLFIYVGVEVASGGWTPTYIQRVAGADVVLAAAAPAALWGAVLVSRLATVWILRFASVAAVLVSGIGLTLAGSVCILLLPSPTVVIAGIAIIGLGLGPIFANTLAYFLEHYGKGANHLSGLLFAAGGVGGGLLPLLIGELSDATGSLRLALWSIPASAVVMFAVLAALTRARPGRNATSHLNGTPG
ncbi:MAG: MFS transporter [Bryobacterales bacterium]|nr:MFS transporter [Bryobacterales bacterium]